MLGLIATVAECSFGGYPYIFGCELEWEGTVRPDAFLFGESQSRYIISSRPDTLPHLVKLLDSHRVPYSKLGVTGGREIVIRVNGAVLIRLAVEEAYRIWYNSLANEVQGTTG